MHSNHSFPPFIPNHWPSHILNTFLSSNYPLRITKLQHSLQCLSPYVFWMTDEWHSRYYSSRCTCYIKSTSKMMSIWQTLTLSKDSSKETSNNQSYLMQNPTGLALNLSFWNYVLRFDVLWSMHTWMEFATTGPWHSHPHTLVGAVDEIKLVVWDAYLKLS
jgi:hypothetical protein